jgi:hypothetical protein
VFEEEGLDVRDAELYYISCNSFISSPRRWAEFRLNCCWDRRRPGKREMAFDVGWGDEYEDYYGFFCRHNFGAAAGTGSFDEGCPLLRIGVRDE